MSEAYLIHQHLEHAARAPERVAIIDKERTMTFGEMLDAVRALVWRLQKVGMERGSRVAILLPKCVEECVAIYAASRADCAFVPINPTLRPQQIKHIVEDCAARVLITSRDLRAQLGDSLDGVDCLDATLLVDEADAEQSVPEDTPLRPAAVIGEDLAAILYTSGSTGLPKGVMLSHRNLIAGTRIVRNYLGIGREDRILSILPFSFDYGLNQLLTTVEQAATIVLFEFKLGDQIVRALKEHRITGFAGVPTIWAILSRTSPLLTKTALPELRYITNSGGAVPSQTVKRLRELLPDTQIFLMYGLTEAFRSTYLPPEELDTRPTSIGKAIPECEVFPVTPDGQRAKPGEPGILVHRGPTVSLGYWNRPEETAKVLRVNPFRSAVEGGETVCYSGDLVTEDEEGFLYFVGRSDAMIKSAGHRISPSEVEETLMASGKFREVAVIGLPDEWVGQKVHCVAVASTGEIDVGTILREAAVQLPKYMLPAQIELTDRLPTTPNGKVDYKRLVAERAPSK